MKNLKAALAGISLTALSGCSSEIDVIREGRLELLPEYTVGQALDNREICQDTDWSTIKDKKGRNIVRYKCEMKGIKEWYHDLGQSLVNGSSTEQEISISKEKLSQMKFKLSRLEQDEVSYSDLNNKRFEGITASQMERYRNLRSTRKSRIREISLLKNEISSLDSKLNSNTIESNNLKTGQYILDHYRGSAAYETIDWLVIEDGSFMPLGGSLYEIKPGDDAFNETPIPDIEAAIYVIYEAEINNYFDYKQAVGIPL